MRYRLPRASAANVLSVLALFTAIGGTAFAATALPRNSVGRQQLQSGAVTSGKVKDGSLLTADISPGQLPRGDRGPAGAPGPVDTSQFASKGQTDAGYERGTITIVASGRISQSDAVAGVWGQVTAACPAGYQAIAGGADTGAGFTHASFALAETSLIQQADGQHGSAAMWRAWFSGPPTPPDPDRLAKVIVVCAPIG
jgi:hypothetical protein